MKLNGSYLWKFLGYDTKRGSYVSDSVLGKNVYSTDYEGKWMDITKKVKSGRNELTYFHFTKGGGFYIQVKIYF